MTSFKSKVSKRNCDGEIPNLCDSLWAACYWKTLRTKKKITKKNNNNNKKKTNHIALMYTLVQHWKYQIHTKYYSHSHELRMYGNRSRALETTDQKRAQYQHFELAECVCTHTGTQRAVTGPTRHHQLSEYSYTFNTWNGTETKEKRIEQERKRDKKRSN